MPHYLAGCASRQMSVHPGSPGAGIRPTAQVGAARDYAALPDHVARHYVPPSDVVRLLFAGPEGWLAPTGLLPCHYFVHSFGSPSSYTLKHRLASNGAVEHNGQACGARPLAPLPSSLAVNSPLLSTAQAALAHMERNYGEAFPEGYTWAQATAPHGAAFLLVTGELGAN